MSSGRFMVISRDGSDFSMDLIFAGLVRRFGAGNVVDYPARQKHRAGRPILVGDHELDYGTERKSLCYTKESVMIPWTRQEVLSLASVGGFGVVFLDETDESFGHYLSIFGSIPTSRRCPVVVVAGHDRFRGSPEEVQARFGENLAAMFIDDWQSDYEALPKTHLINLSINFDHLWDVKNRERYLGGKRYDLCFVGYNSNPVRKHVIDHLRSKWSHLDNHLVLEERPNEFSAFVRHDELFRTMAQSRVCINLPGASACGRALRFYEIPYVGSYMLSMRFPARLLSPLEDGRDCGFFSSLDELDGCIEWAIVNPVERELVAKSGHVWMMRHHTVDARMNYVFDVLRGRV